MILNTQNGLGAHACISALQKFLRRGLEREAMEMAVELGHSSKGFATWVANRLEIIAHEDVGLADPAVITLVATCCEQARRWYDPAKLGVWRMAIGNAIRAIARAPKSREADHFQAAVGLRSQLEGFVPEIPDWVHDQHTRVGKAKGRGLDYFRKVSTQLVPPPAQADRYEDEAYALWALKEKQSAAPPAADDPPRKPGRGGATLF